MLIRWKVLSLLVAVSILVGGCTPLIIGSVVVGGGAAIWYVRGESRTQYPRDVPTVFNAAVAVLEQDLKVPIDSRSYDGTVGKIRAKRADESEVKVALKLVGPSVTRVAVRVGIVGDRHWNELFLDRLSARLRTGA